MRLELIGTSCTPQHSDCRVLDQLVYKWKHSRAILAKVLADKYEDLAATGWEPTRAFSKAAESADEILCNYINKYPGHLPEALLCEGNCAELGLILRGEKEAVQVLFSGIGAELLDQFYGDGLFTSHWLAAIAAAVSCAARKLPEGRGLRILEIGAGTGGLASQVLSLLERGLHSYIFSDVSAAFFSGAAQKLAAFPEVEFKIFDLEKPGADQDLETGAFDFIIGTNVLHAVSDVRAATMPQPMSTPTAAGMIAPLVGMTEPTVAPMPQCTSGMTATCLWMKGSEATFKSC